MPGFDTVTGGINIICMLEIFVDSKTSIILKIQTFQKARFRFHSNSNYDQVGLDLLAIFQNNSLNFFIALKAFHCIPKFEYSSGLLVLFHEELADLFSENVLKRS